MRLIITFAAAAGLAALAACGGAEENAVENFDSDMMVTDNLDMADDNLMTDMNTGEMNIVDDSGNMIGNEAGNAVDETTDNTSY